MSKPATYLSFQTNTAPGGKVQLTSPLGKFMADSPEDVARVASDILSKMAERLGRQPTDAECRELKPKDDRNTQQKMEFKGWKPKRTDNPHPLQNLADSLRDGTDEPDYRGMSLNERLAMDAERIVERHVDSAEANEARQAKLKRLSPQLQKLDSLLDAENWRAENGSQRLADILEMLKLQLTEGNDPQETKRLRKEVKTFLDARAANERSKKQIAVDALQREIARIKGGEGFDDLEAEEIDDRIAALKQQEETLRQEREANDAGIAEIDNQLGAA